MERASVRAHLGKLASHTQRARRAGAKRRVCVVAHGDGGTRATPGPAHSRPDPRPDPQPDPTRPELDTQLPAEDTKEGIETTPGAVGAAASAAAGVERTAAAAAAAEGGRGAGEGQERRRPEAEAARGEEAKTAGDAGDPRRCAARVREDGRASSARGASKKGRGSSSRAARWIVLRKGGVR